MSTLGRVRASADRRRKRRIGDDHKRREPDEGTDATRGTRPKAPGEADLLGGPCPNPFSHPCVLASLATHAKVLVLYGRARIGVLTLRCVLCKE